LTTDSGLVTVDRSIESLVRGTPEAKGGHMSGKALYVKFVLLMLVVAALAVALGGEPWGPN
jgi:hypothetical protein